MPGDFDPELTEYSTSIGEGRKLDLYKVRGGTLGKTSAGLWGYRLTDENQVIAAGENLHTGTPKTHDEATQIVLAILTSFLAILTS